MARKRAFAESRFALIAVNSLCGVVFLQNSDSITSHQADAGLGEKSAFFNRGQAFSFTHLNPKGLSPLQPQHKKVLGSDKAFAKTLRRELSENLVACFFAKDGIGTSSATQKGNVASWSTHYFYFIFFSVLVFAREQEFAFGFSQNRLQFHATRTKLRILRSICRNCVIFAEERSRNVDAAGEPDEKRPGVADDAASVGEREARRTASAEPPERCVPSTQGRRRPFPDLF